MRQRRSGPKRTRPNQRLVPVINLSVPVQNIALNGLPSMAQGASALSPDWQSDFVNGLGQTEEERAPNSSIRVSVPAKLAVPTSAVALSPTLRR